MYSSRPGAIPRISRNSQDITSPHFLPDTAEKAELVLQTVLGENEGRDRCITPSVVLHTLQTVYSSEVTGIDALVAPGARPLSDDDKFMSVVDFTTTYPPDRQTTHTIVRKPHAVFFILSHPRATRKRWDFPNFEMAAYFINDALCGMYHDDMPYVGAYERSGKWGLFSTVLLKTDDLQAIDGFRKHLSHKGESKELWRQIDLKGEDQVMLCLRFIPESTTFKLGVEMVQIRGGLWAQEPAEQQQLLGKRTWTATTSIPLQTILASFNHSQRPTRGTGPNRAVGAADNPLTNPLRAPNLCIFRLSFFLLSPPIYETVLPPYHHSSLLPRNFSHS